MSLKNENPVDPVILSKSSSRLSDLAGENMMIATNDNTLKFSLIIPAWPDEDRPFGLDFIDQLNWPQENLEILIARGYSPCKQRNHAALKNPSP